MNIGMDVDGVMVDFQTTWMCLYESYFGVQLPEPTFDEYDALITYTHFEHIHEFYTWFARAGGWEKVGQAWIPGSRGGVDALLDDGHRVTFITNRPDSALLDTHAWFDLGPWGRDPIVRLIVRPDKWRVPGIDLYVDDTPKMIEELRANGKNAVVFSQPWNLKVEGAAVKDWADLVQALEVPF